MWVWGKGVPVAPAKCCSPPSDSFLLSGQLNVIWTQMPSPGPRTALQMCAGQAPAAPPSAPAPGSTLAELFNGTIAAPQATLLARLRAARLLGLCCAASAVVFQQYRSSLELVLQQEASGRRAAASAGS